MTDAKKKIIDEILKNFNYNTHFENEHFIYWIRESYDYNGDKVSREEFKCIKDYVIKHGTLPCMFIHNEEGVVQRPNHRGFVYGNHNNRVLSPSGEKFNQI